MFTRFSDRGPDLHDLERIEAAARRRFGLGERDLVIVREEPGRAPGAPEKVTTVLFWKGRDRHRIRVFKPAAATGGDDLPAAWVAGALRDDGEADCC